MRITEKERLAKHRKHTIAMKERLRILDGGFVPRPQFDIVHHPRAFNKPLSCQAGKHQWMDKVAMGVPILYCKKCGAGAPRDSYYGVLSKEEARANVPDPTKSINKKSWIDEVVENLNAKSRR